MSSSPVPRLAFSHMGLYATDLARMADFYTRVLGLTETDRGRLGAVELVFLSSNPMEHHQIVLASGRPAEAGFNVINQISFRMAEFAGLREMSEEDFAARTTANFFRLFDKARPPEPAAKPA